jgi:hypothetical protein
MRTNKIELVEDYDKLGNILDSKIYVSKLNISLEIIYECVNILSELEKGNEDIDIYDVADLVVRIYDKQFTQRDLLTKIDAVTMKVELIDQINFFASGQGFKTNNKVKFDNTSTSSWNDYRNYLKNFLRETMKEGKDINELMNMPFSFFMELVDEDNQKNVKHTDSMIQAFM